MIKKCFKCGVERPLSEFYKHPQMKDGHVNKCKTCNKSDVIKNRVKNADYYRDYDKSRAMAPHRVEARKEYQKTENGKAAVLRAHAKYRGNNPEKYKATNMVGNAIRDGKLFKKPCEDCGTEKNIHAHHDDYSKPLKVRWLCAKHHTKWHREQREKI